MIRNTSTSFGIITKLFHWTMFVLFLVMLPLGYIMEELVNSNFKLTLFDFHKSTGLILFSLITLRLIWRYLNVQPKLSASLPAWQHVAAKWNIIILYLLMFAMPMSGFLTSTLGGHNITFYGLFTITPYAQSKALSELFAVIHKYLSFIMIAAISLHVIAALYHHFYLRDAVLRRMVRYSVENND